MRRRPRPRVNGCPGRRLKSRDAISGAGAASGPRITSRGREIRSPDPRFESPDPRIDIVGPRIHVARAFPTTARARRRTARGRRALVRRRTRAMVPSSRRDHGSAPRRPTTHAAGDSRAALYAPVGARRPALRGRADAFAARLEANQAASFVAAWRALDAPDVDLRGRLGVPAPSAWPDPLDARDFIRDGGAAASAQPLPPPALALLREAVARPRGDAVAGARPRRAGAAGEGDLPRARARRRAGRGGRSSRRRRCPRGARSRAGEVTAAFRTA